MQPFVRRLACQRRRASEMAYTVSLFLAALLLWFAAAGEESFVERDTTEGKVRGRIVHTIGREVEEYRGIPFAEPPVGKLRFRPPVRKAPWQGILDTTTVKLTACPQVEVPLLTIGDAVLTEDCLQLNVWVPQSAKEPASSRPVLVWMHGGGFTYGSANEATYNGAVMAALGDVLVVTMNYRLGILGFMSANSPEAPGNVGLLDQLEVLKWVQRNIASFGGDPERVTIFGESAGSVSTHAHVLSPMSDGLFKRAILMSGAMYNIDMWDMIHESMVKGNKVADIVGCSKKGTIDLSSHAEDVVRCFRRKSADELIKASMESIAPKAAPFYPIYHDSFLPKMPLVAMNRGFFGSIDVIAGVTSDEGALMPMFPPKPELLADDLEMSEKLADILHTTTSTWLKEDVPDVLDKYTADAPKGDGNALRRQYLDYAADRMFYCPLRFFADKHSDRGNKVFVYVFDHKSAAAPLPAWAGVPHAAELPFLFGHKYAEDPDSPDGRMSEAFVHALASFAEKGVPELPEKHKWPRYTKEAPIMVVMGHGQFNETQEFRKSQCERWKYLF